MPAGSGIQELGEYIGRRADYKRSLTLERIDTVAEDGSVMIKGQRLPVAGRVQLRAGMTVPVASKDGKMQVVLFGTARRGGSAGPTVTDVAVAVAEVLVGGEGVTYFRDQTNFVSVDFAEAAPQAGIVGNVALRWGVGDMSFVVMRGNSGTPNFHQIAAVCRINRQKQDTHFPKVEKVKLKLVRAYNLSTIGHAFGTLTGSHTAGTPNTATINVTYFASALLPTIDGTTIRSQANLYYVAPNGDLLVSIDAELISIRTGVDGVNMALGSKLVNVTKNAVLANHMVSSVSVGQFSTPSATCGSPVYLLQADVSTGVGLGASGHIVAVLSLKEPNPTKTGTFNSYVLTTPAWTRNGDVFTGGPFSEAIYCGPPMANRNVMVVGEFAQQVDLLKGGTPGPTAFEEIVIQGSRLGACWQVRGLTAQVVDRVRIADFKKKIVSTVQYKKTSANAPLAPDPGGRRFFMGKDELAYSPRDLVAPFTRQFYWAGHSQSGTWSVNLDVPRKVSELAGVAKLAAPRNAAQKAAVNFGDLQVFQEPS